ncbi:hypothetical protein [Bacillus thuringiensis]|uniref:hypothetical protein n=1 Tax=Bacillus thuringiensis TaxID=1428 RepID=UPI0015C511BA|nr:hypothetical protein [Bacillus thuringiensis]
MVINNIGELKKLIKDLPDLMDVEVYDHTNERFIGFQVTEQEDYLEIEVYPKEAK